MNEMGIPNLDFDYTGEYESRQDIFGNLSWDPISCSVVYRLPMYVNVIDVMIGQHTGSGKASYHNLAKIDVVLAMVQELVLQLTETESNAIIRACRGQEERLGQEINNLDMSDPQHDYDKVIVNAIRTTKLLPNFLKQLVINRTASSTTSVD